MRYHHILTAIVLLLTGLLLPTSAMAQTTRKSAEVRKLEQRRQAIQDEIKRVNQLLNQTTNTTKGELKKLELLQGQIRSRQEIIQTLKNEIAATDQQINDLEGQIDLLLKQFGDRQTSYVKSIRALQHRTGAEDRLLFVLSAEDFAHGLRRARYLGEYAKWQRDEANKLKSLREEIEAQRTALMEVRNHKDSLFTAQQTEQERLRTDEANIQQQVTKLKGQQQELQKELAKQKKQAAALNKQIEAQIAKEIKEAEEARRRAEEARKKGQKGTTRKAATKGGYAMTDEEVKLSGSFEQNKGRLPMPITGSYAIVGYFGEQSVAGLQYVKVNNSGIDIQGTSGAEAKAIFDGVVTRVFTLEGYNNSVIVRHGNYLSVYSNLTNVYVKTGTKLKTGQTIGKIYADPELGGATKLHFQVWKETTKLNPLSWLRH